MPVNKERVQLLVDALRSGEFPQGKGMLRTSDDTYCCIGVGCEVARRNGIGIEWVEDGEWTFDGFTTEFTKTLMDWYGFTPEREGDGDPYLTQVTEPMRGGVGLDDDYLLDVSMTSANDDHGWTFERIADAIEARYLAEDE